MSAGLLVLPEIVCAASLDGHDRARLDTVVAASALSLPAGTLPVVVVLGGPGSGGSALLQRQAQLGIKTPQPAPTLDRSPSSADLVNKLLSPGPSDPNVPLFRRDLADDPGAGPDASDGPRIYGRQEEGGGVFGFKVPIPADRSASGASH